MPFTADESDKAPTLRLQGEQSSVPAGDLWPPRSVHEKTEPVRYIAAQRDDFLSMLTGIVKRTLFRTPHVKT
ncbi:MAG TPA: hypothetical protein VGD01_11740 [Candidatus Elarobacter sp.]|jgi:hypothetical protein